MLIYLALAWVWSLIHCVLLIACILFWFLESAWFPSVLHYKNLDRAQTGHDRVIWTLAFIMLLFCQNWGLLDLQNVASLDGLFELLPQCLVSAESFSWYCVRLARAIFNVWDLLLLLITFCCLFWNYFTNRINRSLKLSTCACTHMHTHRVLWWIWQYTGNTEKDLITTSLLLER